MDASLVVKHTFLELSPELNPQGRRRADTDSIVDYSWRVECCIEDKASKFEVGSDVSTALDRWSDEDEPITVCSSADVMSVASGAYVPSPDHQLMLVMWPDEASTPSSCGFTVPEQVFYEAKTQKKRARKHTRCRQQRDDASHAPRQTLAFQDRSNHTTLVLRRLPEHLTRESLRQLLDNHGFERLYDFVYLPVDFKKMRSLRYAIVNFDQSSTAQRAFSCFNNFNEDGTALSAEWSDSHFGLDALVRRYQDSPVLGVDMPDICKPVLLNHGERVPFPRSCQLR